MMASGEADTMSDTMTAQLDQMTQKAGFIAALDQSGGSTPGALRAYGVADSDYSGDAEMFALIHEMRVRIMTAPAFRSDEIIAAILFEATMDGDVRGKPVPAYLWEDRGVVPFLKIDKGLEDEADGVSLMKPISGLDATLERAVKLGIFGTKMRSTIRLASPTGIAAIVAQQFELAAQIAGHGLMPILEPEILIKSPDKSGAERLLLDAILEYADRLPAERNIMIKLTLPETANHYAPLVEHPRVTRVVALSGGYSRDEACERLAVNDGVIASFSRALIGDLRRDMDEAKFDVVLAGAIDQIFQASTIKRTRPL
jgi:fructose-bisphosphate aldolase class I